MSFGYEQACWSVFAPGGAKVAPPPASLAGGRSHTGALSAALPPLWAQELPGGAWSHSKVQNVLTPWQRRTCGPSRSSQCQLVSED